MINALVLVPAGAHTVEWAGRSASPGVYLLDYRYPGGHQMRRVVRLRTGSNGLGDHQVKGASGGMETQLARDARRMRLPAQMSPEYRDLLLRTRWRHKNGLEARALVALARSPQALAVAREKLGPADFQTAAYLVAATFLLRADPELPAFEAIRDELDERPYLPAFTPDEWEAEALVDRLVQRRERWAGRHAH